MAHRLERLRAWAGRHRRVVLIGLAAALIGGVLLSRPGHRPETGALQSLVVQPRPFTATVGVVGVIKADQPLDVVAPFDGAVAEVGFTYGDPVAAGQILVRMDDFEIIQRVREARTAFLKAQEAAGEMAVWGSSPEVSRARRAKQSADLELAETRRKLDETKGLLDRGLVPRSEYDGLMQQLRSQQISAAAAQEDLVGAVKRGQGPNREIASLDLASSRARLADLQSQLEAAVLGSPAAGVMIRPPATTAGDTEVHVGQRLSRGQLIGSIARRDSLVVEFALNEADAGRVKVGQSASASGGGLGDRQLSGKVVSVAGEAKPSATGSGSSTVLARVRLTDIPTDAAGIRIGATANVSIKVREVRRAIVVPSQAVLGAPPIGQVRVKDPKTGKSSPRQVMIGETSPEGAEVLLGLQAGQTIVWPTPAASPSR